MSATIHTNRPTILIQNQWIMDYTTVVVTADNPSIPDTTSKDGVLVTADDPIDCRGAKGVTITINASDVLHTSTDSLIRIISSYDNIGDLPTNWDSKYQEFIITDGSITTHQLTTPINWIKIRTVVSDVNDAKPLIIVNVTYN